MYQDDFVSGFTLFGCAVTAGIDEVFFSPTPTSTSVSSTSSPTPASTSTNGPATPSPAVNLGAVIGGVVGAVLFLLLLVLLVLCLRRRKRRVSKKIKSSTASKTTATIHNTTNNSYQVPSLIPFGGRSRSRSGQHGPALPPTAVPPASGLVQMTAYHRHDQYPPPPVVVIYSEGTKPP